MLIGKRKYLWLLSVLGVEKRVVYFAVSVGSFIALQAQTNFPPKLPSVKGRLNFSSKSTTAVNVHLTESLLDNWLKNNHITVDIIYYSRSLGVLVSKSFLNRRKQKKKKQNFVATC